MFQFLTDVVEDEHVLEQLRQGTVRSAVLEGESHRNNETEGY
jgi:hypothetical protein